MPEPRARAIGATRSSYARITDDLIALLDAGGVPWRRPWTSRGPCNLVSRRPYRGINVLVLACQGRPSPWWLTYRQAIRLGGHIREDERGTQVVFWRVLDPGAPGAAHGPRRTVVLRTYTVFHEEQCVLPDDAVPPVADAGPGIGSCDRVVDGMADPPHIVSGSDIACYLPTTDTIHIPRRADFPDAEAYYATLFHELGHATGHPRRLNRSALVTPAPFGSPDYSQEELVAEMTSAFVCGATGIAPVTLSASAEYVAGWLQVLRADRRLVVVAAGQAQQAADLILARSPDVSAGADHGPIPARPPSRRHP